MDFEFGKSQKDIQKAAREFAKGEFDKELALELDRKHEFPRKIWQKAAQLGFIGVHYPEAYSGQGLGVMENILIAEEFCARDSGIGSAVIHLCVLTFPGGKRHGGGRTGSGSLGGHIARRGGASAFRLLRTGGLRAVGPPRIKAIACRPPESNDRREDRDEDVCSDLQNLSRFRLLDSDELDREAPVARPVPSLRLYAGASSIR